MNSIGNPRRCTPLRGLDEMSHAKRYSEEGPLSTEVTTDLPARLVVLRTANISPRMNPLNPLTDLPKTHMNSDARLSPVDVISMSASKDDDVHEDRNLTTGKHASIPRKERSPSKSRAFKVKSPKHIRGSVDNLDTTQDTGLPAVKNESGIPDEEPRSDAKEDNHQVVTDDQGARITGHDTTGGDSVNKDARGEKDGGDTSPSSPADTSQSKLVAAGDGGSCLSIDPEDKVGCNANPREEEPNDSDVKAYHTSQLYRLVSEDDLYDDAQVQCFVRQRAEPKKIFLPKLVEDELLRAIVKKDIEYLALLAGEVSPAELEQTKDSDGRSPYHYAALSSSVRVQSIVFGFVSSYFDRYIFDAIDMVRAKQQRLRQRSEAQCNDLHHSDAPRVNELRAEMEQLKFDSYNTACGLVDSHGRSFLHYVAVKQELWFDYVDNALLKAIQSDTCILSSRDQFGRTPLHYAVINSNLAAMKFFFSLGICNGMEKTDVEELLDLNTSPQVQSSLYRMIKASETARSKNNHQVDATEEHSEFALSVYFLASMKSSVTFSMGRKLHSALHKSAIAGSTASAEMIVKNGADVNARDADGWTSLHHCAAGATSQHIEIADHLIENRAYVNARTLQGRTPLHIVAEVVDGQNCFRRRNPDKAGFTLLLLKHGAKLDAEDDDKCTPFLVAARAGNIPVVRCLLEAGCKRDVKDHLGGNALHLAASHGRIEMVRFLCRWDAESMLWARMKDNRGRIPNAVTAKTEVTRAMQNLWNACYEGSIKTVQLCIKNHSCELTDKAQYPEFLDVDDKTFESERTALHLVAQGYWDIVKSRSAPSGPLSRRKAPSWKENQGNEATKRFVQIILFLLKRGARVSSGDKWGITPLMLAACVNDDELIGVLLNGSTQQDLEHRDSRGNTALHYSYAFCNASVSSLIEDAMDNTEPENDDGKTPLAVTAFKDKLFPREYCKHSKRVLDLRERVLGYN